ncbi:hypothetical protein D3C71_1984330 [compost metagenome]
MRVAHTVGLTASAVVTAPPLRVPSPDEGNHAAFPVTQHAMGMKSRIAAGGLKCVWVLNISER